MRTGTSACTASGAEDGPGMRVMVRYSLDFRARDVDR